MTLDRCCANCGFFDGGSCRRFPPASVPWPTDNQHPIMYEPATTWPLVRATDWCGEFKVAQELLKNTP